MFLGSALTFDALLAALPFTFLVLSVFGYALHAGEESVADVVRIMDAVLPTGGSAESVRRFEILVEQVIESRAAFGLWSIPLFLWFATRLFSSARAALNEVFDTEERRPYFWGKGVDLLMVLLSLAIVLANAMVTIAFVRAPFLGRFVSELSTFTLGALLFFAVYRVLPSRPIRWDTAALAAAVASLGFEIARGLFALYLANFATFDRILSNANAIAVLLVVLWMYYTACLFLLGGEVADTYDLLRRQREQRMILS